MTPRPHPGRHRDRRGTRWEVVVRYRLPRRTPGHPDGPRSWIVPASEGRRLHRTWIAAQVDRARVARGYRSIGIDDTMTPEVRRVPELAGTALVGAWLDGPAAATPRRRWSDHQHAPSPHLAVDQDGTVWQAQRVTANPYDGPNGARMYRVRDPRVVLPRRRRQ